MSITETELTRTRRAAGNPPAYPGPHRPTDAGKHAGKIAVYALLIAFSAISMFPLLWMISTSLKDSTDAVKIPPQWIPNPVRWSNYERSTKVIDFWTYAGNTIFLCAMNVIGTVLSCSLAAFGFSHIDWRGRDKLFAFSLLTMMIPFPVLLVPTYTIFRNLGWIGTYMPLWVPAFFGSAYNIFLLRQFFLTIPRDLTEAAEVDGCGRFRMYWQIILPLSRPALAVVALFCLMYNWNDFMGPLIYLLEPKQFTLALGLQQFQSRLGGTEVNLLMAASTLTVLPIMVLFFFTQRTFIEGISMTGIKG